MIIQEECCIIPSYSYISETAEQYWYWWKGEPYNLSRFPLSLSLPVTPSLSVSLQPTFSPHHVGALCNSAGCNSDAKLATPAERCWQWSLNSISRLEALLLAFIYVHSRHYTVPELEICGHAPCAGGVACSCRTRRMGRSVDDRFHRCGRAEWSGSNNRGRAVDQQCQYTAWLTLTLWDPTTQTSTRHTVKRAPS